MQTHSAGDGGCTTRYVCIGMGVMIWASWAFGQWDDIS